MSSTSSSSHSPLPADALRGSRSAMLAFVTNGALVGSLLPRYPEIADALDLSTARLGLVVVCFAVGAAMAGSLPQVPLRRFGTRRVTVAGTWGIAFALWLAALLVSFGPSATWWFAACLALAGFGDAIVDVSQNAQGLRVQQVLGRSVLSRMHAGWSAGASGRRGHRRHRCGVARRPARDPSGADRDCARRNGCRRRARLSCRSRAAIATARCGAFPG